MKTRIIIIIIVMAAIAVGVFFVLRPKAPVVDVLSPAEIAEKTALVESLSSTIEFTPTEMQRQQEILESLSSTTTPSEPSDEEIRRQEEIMRSLQSR